MKKITAVPKTFLDGEEKSRKNPEPFGTLTHNLFINKFSTATTDSGHPKCVHFVISVEPIDYEQLLANIFELKIFVKD